MSSKPEYNFQYSDMILMIGGKILIVVFIIMLVLFGTQPMSFPANAVRAMFKNGASGVANALKNAK